MTSTVALPKPTDADVGDVRILIVDGTPHLQVRVQTHYTYEDQWLEPHGIALHGSIYHHGGSPAISATVSPNAIYLVSSPDPEPVSIAMVAEAS